VKRREFIAGLGAAAWPLGARAQQTERTRRIGVLVIAAENDRAVTRYIGAFRESLARLGWSEERNLRIDLRYGSADSDRIRTLAEELVGLVPDIIVTSSANVTRAVQRQTRTIPIVITAVGDPATNGIVKNIASPEANITGITNLFSSIGSKWLELLKEAAPAVHRVGLLYDPQIRFTAEVAEFSYFSEINKAARILGVRTVDIPYSNAVDIVRGIDSFSTEPNSGLIVMPPGPSAADRKTLLSVAAQYRLPAVYQDRSFAAEGGLMTYGSNIVDRWRRASYFVDRILRGARVSELPVEFPTKFELVINVKAAKAIGLVIPDSLLLRADELIE
jgi:putative ABC transport system substrate-binding protein